MVLNQVRSDRSVLACITTEFSDLGRESECGMRRVKEERERERERERNLEQKQKKLYFTRIVV